MFPGFELPKNDKDLHGETTLPCLLEIIERAKVREVKYSDLNETQKGQAKAMFFNACENDGFWYQLNCDDKVLCRNRVRQFPR